jgi:hypothetical protein
MPWAQAIQAKGCTIISIADSSRIARGTRATIFNMHPVEALQHRASRFEIVFDGGVGVGGNVERRSWPPATASSKTFSISRSGHRSEERMRG